MPPALAKIIVRGTACQVSGPLGSRQRSCRRELGERREFSVFSGQGAWSERSGDGDDVEGTCCGFGTPPANASLAEFFDLTMGGSLVKLDNGLVAQARLFRSTRPTANCSGHNILPIALFAPPACGEWQGGRKSQAAVATPALSRLATIAPASSRRADRQR
jgi:hypothetical protein